MANWLAIPEPGKSPVPAGYHETVRKRAEKLTDVAELVNGQANLEAAIAGFKRMKADTNELGQALAWVELQIGVALGPPPKAGPGRGKKMEHDPSFPNADLRKEFRRMAWPKKHRNLVAEAIREGHWTRRQRLARLSVPKTEKQTQMTENNGLYRPRTWTAENEADVIGRRRAGESITALTVDLGLTYSTVYKFCAVRQVKPDVMENPQTLAERFQAYRSLILRGTSKEIAAEQVGFDNYKNAAIVGQIVREGAAFLAAAVEAKDVTLHQALTIMKLPEVEQEAKIEQIAALAAQQRVSSGNRPRNQQLRNVVTQTWIDWRSLEHSFRFTVQTVPDDPEFINLCHNLRQTINNVLDQMERVRCRKKTVEQNIS